MRHTESARKGMGLEASEKTMNVGSGERTASMLGGAGLAAYGISQLISRRFLRGAVLAAAGGMMLYRGKTGYCSLYEALGINRATAGEDGIDIRESVTVDRPRAEVYQYWRNLENLPNFMKYVESVTPTGGNRYHWIAETPAEIRVEWDSEVTEERENELISWRSVPGSQVHHEGQVRFGDGGGDTTEVTVEMTYHPPKGVSAALSRMFNFVTAGHVRKELNRFKKLMEPKDKKMKGGKFEDRPAARASIP
jgi:uncharacterized membrane protein